MGIDKRIINSANVSIKYWNVGKDINYSLSTKQAVGVLCGYVDEESRKANKEPVVVKVLSIDNRYIPVPTKVKPTVQDIKAAVPLEGLYEIEEFPELETIELRDPARVTDENPNGIYHTTGTKPTGKMDKRQRVYTDEELLEKYKNMEITKNVDTLVNFFDEFNTFFTEGKYLEGLYNFISKHPDFKELADGVKV